LPLYLTTHLHYISPYLFYYSFLLFFFFNDPAPTEIYTTRHTLSLHDALPILSAHRAGLFCPRRVPHTRGLRRSEEHTSELQSRLVISYAVFCLKKKKKTFDINSCVWSFDYELKREQNNTQ